MSSGITQRNTSSKDKKRKEKNDEDSDDKLTDDFSEEELTKEEIKAQEGKQVTMRNVPIPISPLSNAMVRTIYTLLMLFGFILIILAGPFYCSLLITAITTGIFREIINLKRKTSREYRIPYFNHINWYFFFVGVFYFYGSFIASQINEENQKLPQFLIVALSYHKFASFVLWIIGFLMFVLSLKQGFLRYQFRLFGWTHLTLFIVVAQTSVIIMNLYQGLVWFILPAMLVISNDIFAYIFGKMFGKTKLIDLSPNKTWEGFIGGFFSSLFFAVFITPFSFSQCKENPFFVNNPYQLPTILSSVLPFENVYFSQFQMHSLYLSLFASLIAPFGGFFASGFKRALSVKDFGQSIPGHGGITDRMDCQLLMGTFTFCYLNYIIIGSVAGLAASVVSSFKKLPFENQADVLRQLQQYYQERLNQQPNQ